MESGAADPQSLRNSSERQFVPGNPISKTANAVFWGKIRSHRVRKCHEIGADAPHHELWWKYGAWFAFHVATAQKVLEQFSPSQSFLGRLKKFSNLRR
jgi:hypothetical protein